jgi:hypothetical protein
MVSWLAPLKKAFAKKAIGSLYLRPGSVRRIQFGPLRGMVFRVGPFTGLSPWYSGAERDHQRAFRRLVGPGWLVVDLGANWGLHTLYLSRLVGAEGKVIAVECFSPAFAELKWHLAANRCNNVTAVQVALSDRNGQADFFPGENGCTGSLISPNLPRGSYFWWP